MRLGSGEEKKKGGEEKKKNGREDETGEKEEYEKKERKGFCGVEGRRRRCEMREGKTKEGRREGR